MARAAARFRARSRADWSTWIPIPIPIAVRVRSGSFGSPATQRRRTEALATRDPFTSVRTAPSSRRLIGRSVDVSSALGCRLSSYDERHNCERFRRRRSLQSAVCSAVRSLQPADCGLELGPLLKPLVGTHLSSRLPPTDCTRCCCCCCCAGAVEFVSFKWLEINSPKWPARKLIKSELQLFIPSNCAARAAQTQSDRIGGRRALHSTAGELASRDS